MNVIEMTRQLGEAIQQDEKYIAFTAAKRANDEDMALNALIGKLNLVQMAYQNESGKESPDEQKLSDMDYTSISEIGAYGDWITAQSETESLMGDLLG